MLDAGRAFDAIVLDRPSSRRPSPTPSAPRVPTRTSTASRSCCCGPGGALFTFSCSGGISPDLFHKIVASPARARRRRRRPRLRAARRRPDHPMTVNFPEGEYLKGLVILKR
jgi:23S rRNA (cytosine1962-C5)-methyltransferase